jgi:hypothetical protein
MLQFDHHDQARLPPLLLLASSLASAAELTEMEVRWLKAGSAVLATPAGTQAAARHHRATQARANDVPLALGYDNGRCKLVLSMRGNPNAEDILNNVRRTTAADD